MAEVNGGYDGEDPVDPEPPSTAEAKRTGTRYRVYKWRWYVLAVLCLLNVSNAMLWINLAPIATIADEYYDHQDAADAFSITFMAVSIPLMFVAMWGIDSFGVRSGIWVGAGLNFVGALVRFISALGFVPQAHRFPVAIFGQVMAASAQPAIMFLPTKVAALWFPQEQRAIANTLGSMCNPLGIMVAYLTTPAIAKDTTHMLRLNGLSLGPASAAILLGWGGIWHSLPPSPPTASAEAPSDPFLPGLKNALRNKSFLVLMLAAGGGVGLFNAIYSLLQQIACVKGYNNDVVGNCGGLLIGGGLIGAGIAGAIVDATKRFQEVAKTCYGIAAVIACGIAVVLLRENLTPALYSLMFFFGFFGFAMYPIALEMGVEVTFPVAEATSAGLIICSGQVLGIVFLVLMTVLSTVQSPSSDDIRNFGEFCKPPSAHNLTSFATASTAAPSSANVPNWTIANTVFAVLCCLLSLTLILGFWPKYKRMAAEEAASGAQLQAPPLEEDVVVHM